MTTDNVTITVPNSEAKITSETQYGVRFPNGEITWGIIDRGSNYRNVFIGDLIPGAAPQVSDKSRANWEEMLKVRADKAQINVDSYAEMHTFVKRSITVAVTAPEDV